LSQTLNTQPYSPNAGHASQNRGARDREGRCNATWKREFKLPWREAGPPNHHDDKVDSDQEVVNKELSLSAPPSLPASERRGNTSTERHGQNLAVAVLQLPHSLGSGQQQLHAGINSGIEQSLSVYLGNGCSDLRSIREVIQSSLINYGNENYVTYWLGN